jgi:polyferredoxin
MVSYIVLAALVAGALVVPMFFCRYLCPLGAVFDPFSRLGIVKIVRNDTLCTHCDACQQACPHDLTPQKMIQVRHRDCTVCLECVDACPAKGALELRATF